MEWWIILLIALAVLVVLAIGFFVSRRAGERRVEQKRVEAAELRNEGELRSRRADERQALAEEQAEHARREREEAEERLRRAEDVDPDVRT